MTATPVVCVVGDESFLVDRALAEIREEALAGGDPGLNSQTFEAPAATPAEVVNAARTLPFLGGRRLVVVKSAERWSADDWKVLLPYLGSPNPTTCLVFVALQLDKRLTATKALLKAARVVECARPKERDLPAWARRLVQDAGLQVDARILDALVLRVGPDLQLLAREIEKLRIFAGEGGRVALEDVEALVGETRATTVFAFCDALGVRNLGKALGGLRKLLHLGEPAPRLLFMVVRHFRHLWVGRELLERGGRPDPRAAASAMGVPPFAAENVLRQARGWQQEDLREAFGRFVQADLGLKSGAGDEVLEKLVLDLVGPGNEARPGGDRGAQKRVGVSNFRP
jgi:DNA polymerase-3 subunit delta